MGKTIKDGSKKGYRTKSLVNKSNKSDNGKNSNLALLSEDTAPTDHHIVPGSRMHEDGYKEYVGRNNIADVPKGKHVDFHRLFFNLTPPEILAFLVDDFWRGQINWVEMYLSHPDYFSQMKEKRKLMKKGNGKSARPK